MKNAGLTINDIHISDYGLILTDLDIASPVVKKKIITLPGTDGVIDLTTAVSGRVNYESRKITLSFKAVDKGAIQWQTLYSNLLNLYHGKDVKLIFDFDDKYFWLGRAELTSTKTFKNYSTFVLVVECEPFKWSIYSSAENYLWDTFNFETDNANDLSEIIVDGSIEVIVVGSIVASNPIIIADTVMKVEYEGTTYPVKQGEYKNYNITLKNGENILKFIGDGVVKVNVRGGSL